MGRTLREGNDESLAAGLHVCDLPPPYPFNVA